MKTFLVMCCNFRDAGGNNVDYIAVVKADDISTAKEKVLIDNKDLVGYILIAQEVTKDVVGMHMQTKPCDVNYEVMKLMGWE